MHRLMLWVETNATMHIQPLVAFFFHTSVHLRSMFWTDGKNYSSQGNERPRCLLVAPAGVACIVTVPIDNNKNQQWHGSMLIWNIRMGNPLHSESMKPSNGRMSKSIMQCHAGNSEPKRMDTVPTTDTGAAVCIDLYLNNTFASTPHNPWT